MVLRRIEGASPHMPTFLCEFEMWNSWEPGVEPKCGAQGRSSSTEFNAELRHGPQGWSSGAELRLGVGCGAWGVGRGTRARLEGRKVRDAGHETQGPGRDGRGA